MDCQHSILRIESTAFYDSVICSLCEEKLCSCSHCLNSVLEQELEALQ